MKRIAVLSRKGGTGKTTVAGNLAWEFSRTTPVRLIDADDQEHAFRWAEGWDGVTVDRIIDPAQIKDALNDRGGRGLTIVDCPAHDPNVAAAAVGGADLIVIPLSAGIFDLWAITPLVGVLVKAVPILAVLTRVTSGSLPSAQAREVLVAQGVRVASTALVNRVAHVQAQVHGKPISVYEPKGAAARELQALAKEITSLLQMEGSNGRW